MSENEKSAISLTPPCTGLSGTQTQFSTLKSVVINDLGGPEKI
jgi:hypothetical protein